MDSVLKGMIVIYKPDGIDWLNFKLQKKSPYTFHHIQEVRNGGIRTITNGAILVRIGHNFLNLLDNQDHRTYVLLNGVFKELNQTQQPPTDDYYEEVDHILRPKQKILMRDYNNSYNWRR